MVGGGEKYSIGLVETIDFSGILNGLCTYTMEVFIGEVGSSPLLLD